MYELPNDDFYCDLEKGLGKNEWTCKSTVKPTGTTEYPSAVDAMIEHGVQVYFVDQETFDAMKADKEEHGMRILMKIESENHRRGENSKAFVLEEKKL